MDNLRSILVDWFQLGTLYNTPLIESYLFKPGTKISFRTLKANLTIYAFIPGNNYLGTRWREDMSEFTNANSSLGFGRGLRETFKDIPSWTQNHGQAGMIYEQTISGKLHYPTVALAYGRTDPLERYVTYRDSITGK